MLDHLEELRAGRPVPLAEGVKNFCLRNSGKGIVVLFSDLMDKAGYEAALRYLSRPADGRLRRPCPFGRGVEPGAQGDLRLVDCEDGTRPR